MGEEPVRARWDCGTPLILTRDLRAKRNDDDWLVHFRANAPANYGMAMGDAAFAALIDFAGGRVPALPDETDEQTAMKWLLGHFVDAGFLIPTTYEIGTYDGAADAPLSLDLGEVRELRRRIDIDDLGLLELECVVLYVLVRGNSSPAPVCELGCLLGGSTIALATAAARAPVAKRVLAVDDHEWHRHLEEGSFDPQAAAALPSSLPRFKENLARAGVAEAVEVVVGDTARAGRDYDGEISVLFIDANHALEGVRADFEAWFPHLVPGGVVAFHDYGNPNWPDVKVVVDKLRPRFRAFTVYQTLAVGVKGETC